MRHRSRKFSFIACDSQLVEPALTTKQHSLTPASRDFMAEHLNIICHEISNLLFVMSGLEMVLAFRLHLVSVITVQSRLYCHFISDNRIFCEISQAYN